MIEVEEYVRTKTKGIRKIDDIDERKTVNKYLYYIGTDDDNDPCFGIIKTTDIVKHSKNIIDLIEVGDYVNGHLVVEISKNAYNQKIVITEVDGKDGAIRHHYLERSIKNVVTHEQFESIEYKVEE